MKKRFLTIVLALLFAASLVCIGYASNGSVQALLYYRDIKLTMNGTEFTPTDVNGNVVEPFIIDGTTYLPVRAVSGALGLDVGWDEATSTVSLSEPRNGQAIYITRTGSKYHHDSTCNGGTYWEVPLESAIGMGLTPCEKCAGGMASTEYGRLNPAPVGVAQTITVDNYSYNYSATVTVKEILTGNAMASILGSPVANDSPDDGCEMIAVKISLTLDSVSEDRSVSFSSIDFDAYTSNNEFLNYKYMFVTEGNRFGSILYAGGNMEGYIIIQRKIDDTGAKMAFGLGDDGTGGIWFAIG